MKISCLHLTYCHISQKSISTIKLSLDGLWGLETYFDRSINAATVIVDRERERESDTCNVWFMAQVLTGKVFHVEKYLVNAEIRDSNFDIALHRYVSNGKTNLSMGHSYW